MKNFLISIGILIALAIPNYGLSQSFEELMTQTSDSLQSDRLSYQTEGIIDKAITLANDNSREKWDAILMKAELYKKRYAYRKIISLLKPQLSNIYNDTIKADYYGEIGRAYRFLSITDSSLYYLNLALNLAQKHELGRREIKFHNNIGSANFRAFKVALAFKEYDTAIFLMTYYNDSTEFLPIMGNAAACLLQMGSYQTAIKYYKKLEANFSDQNPHMGLIYANLGATYLEIDSFNTSETYLLKAASHLKANDKLRFLGTVYFNLIEVYLEKEEFEKALRYAELAEPIYLKTQPTRMGYLYSGFGDIYEKLNQNQKALDYYNKAYNFVKDKKEWNEATTVTKKLSRLYEKMGNYEKAYSILREFIKYQDSLTEDNKLEALEKYRIEFESEQSEIQIEQLEKLNSAKSEIISEKKKTQKIITGVFIILILLVLLGSFFYYKFKVANIKLENKSKLLELDNKLILNRLSPHFIFNVLNSIQYYINSDDRKKANYYLTVFAGLLRKFLESFSVEHHSLEDELNLIEEYVELERMLSNDKFKFVLNIGNGVNQQESFPTMLLQPLVENAIKHGTKSSNPVIKLSIKSNNQTVDCIVEDNGSGISEFKSKGSSRGIEIFKQHIDILNANSSKKISLTWENKTGEETGLKVLLQIPVNYRDEN